MRRAQRLQRPAQFRRVREAGSRWSNRLLSLAAARNRSGRTRCGFVVGKHLGGAVTRNRLKRRTREAVRLLYHQIAPGWDLVFSVRPAAEHASFIELQQAVVRLLQDARLWQAPAPQTGHANQEAQG